MTPNAPANQYRMNTATIPNTTAKVLTCLDLPPATEEEGMDET